MPKTVIFHIGLPKTGTTTIQDYLRSQDEKLRSLGVLYPGAREHPALKWSKHLLILSALSGNQPPKSGGLDARGCREAVARIFTEFRDSDLEKLVWSHEGISSRLFSLDAEYWRSLVQGMDVGVLLSVRFIDDWIESLFKERIRAQGGPATGKIERLGPEAKPKVLVQLAPKAIGETGKKKRAGKNMLKEASRIPATLRTLREILPAAEIVVQSYDANREKGTVVSGALAAMGLPVASAFPDADKNAGVRNPTKPDLYSMLVYHLVRGQADYAAIRAVTMATKRRNRAGVQFEPLSGRRFRFLSEEAIVEARGYYEELRHDYPNLPTQRPYAPDPAERSLPKEDAIALLDWLRPDISDAVFDEACAAYAPM